MKLNFSMLSPVQQALRYLLYVFSIILLLSVFWIKKTFGNPSYEQIIFHIMYQTKDYRNFDISLIYSYGISVIFVALIISWLFFKLEIKYIKRTSKLIFVKFTPFYIILIGIFLSYRHFGGDTGYSGYVGAGAFNTYNPFYSDKLTEKNLNYFADNYLDPKKINLSPRDKKNLILIYVESFEKTYSNHNYFKVKLTKSLDAIDNGVSFSDFKQVPGTGWTIAGIVSSQCAVPLKVVFMRDGNGQGDGKSFMPNAICLGDTFKTFGYKNIFLNGPSVSFAGVDLFLKSHGYDEILGKEEWLATGKYHEKDFNYWGLQDDDLFMEARTKLDTLIKQGDLFNLTLLTVNTHGPDGFLSKSCIKSGGKSYEDIVKCTSDEVAKFIEYVKIKGYDQKTNIVVLGDHLSIPNPVIDKLKSDPNRAIYNLFVTKNKFAKSRDNIIHFDFAPTILDLSGIHVIGGRYGLGYSAIKSSNANIEPPSTRVADMNRDLLNVSPKYLELWIPK